ncbi:ABC transporter substrate-binding protein [Dysosmobacter sp.]|uniref:ABC transporter substrate-binding protein n=1 Tax=Dysosmobacter sp. TaxID=2591382 RepID=UPI002A941DB3|nr:ABC transporter substrate-binding protein [Dysosmobacter sp.]MDY5510659.1 ABC transporter substrate-binding protein [Dysosmobacter sp.]
MKKKLLALTLAALMALSLAACGGDTASTDTEAAEDEAAETTETSGQVYNIGICQLAPHPALDAATEGFIDAVTEALGAENVNIDNQNAAGDSPTCGTIINGFVSANVDLILANATAPLQTAAAATATIPVLGTSVTEYGVALGIDGFTGTVGTNVSGTSDLAPLDQQAAMVKEWFPDAKTVGLLYCSAEPNSQYQVDNVQAYLEELGYTCTQYSFSDTNDMASVTQNAADNSDVIYVPTDNTVANNTGVVDNICRPAGVPVIAGEEGICSGCGVATLSISYYDLGVATGEMAVKILTGEANVAEMPIEYAPQFTKKYNEAICADLGLTVPEGYEAIAAE